MDKIGILMALIEHFCEGNKSQFAKRLGIKPQTVNTWLSRGTFDIELVYSKCEGISSEWLLRGEGPMLREASPKAETPKVEASVQTKTGKTKASASAPGTADSAFFMDYIRTKDTMIEQKSQEIASLTGKVARLEAENAFLREQLSRLQG